MTRSSALRAWVNGSVVLLLVGFLAWASTPLWRLTDNLPEWLAWIIPAAQATFFLGVAGILVCAALLAWRWRGTSRRPLLASRSWWLSMLSVLCGLALVVPAIFTGVSQPEIAPRAPVPSLRVMFLNTYFNQAEDAAIVDAVGELRPDVLILAETSEDEVAAVEEGTGLQASVPVLQRTPGAATVVLTRGGVNDADEDAGLTRHQMPVTSLAEPAAAVAGIHTDAPVHSDLVGGWVSEMADLRDWVPDAHPDTPLVMAGDFNSSATHPEFRDLVGDNDLKKCEGNVLGPPTWPARFPVARLDHILVRGGSCGDGGTARVDGSDHRAVWADVTF